MLRNSNIAKMDVDVLYHFALDTKQHDLPAMFGDVRFVLMGGSARRMERLSHYFLRELGITLPTGQTLVNIARATDRYALYKVGPVLLASHGMGMASASIMLHEMMKLVHHAGCIKDIVFIRLGTCGGLGLEPGTVVVSEQTVDGMLRPFTEKIVLGKRIVRPAILDSDLGRDLLGQSRPEDNFSVVLGKTLCTDDFYEGQARRDGAICEYTEEETMAYLKHAHENGVRNIEMESLVFASMCHYAGIKGAVICVTILNRFHGDQLTASKATMTEWEWNPAQLVSRLIKKRLSEGKLETTEDM